MYNNEKSDQLFIRLDPKKDPIEFLLDRQPLEMIRASILTKEEIRQTIETGFLDVPSTYSKAFKMPNYDIVMNVFVRIDDYLRVIEKIEKVYF